MPRPNILYLHSHDTGRYIQPYGHAIPAPNAQRLAEEGVLFRQAFCAAPTCSPSRAALLTGSSPHSCGMTGLAHRGFSLNDYSQHIVHTLRDAGYRSTLFGVQHVADDPSRIGYDVVADLPSRHVADVAPAAAEWLVNGPQEPFFLSVGFSETHREYLDPGPEQDPRYTLPPAPLPDTPAVRRDMAGYKATAAVLDQGIGTVLDALDDAGLAENTLVICTTDHGIAFPHIKCNLTDHGIGVMLIMRGPGGFRGGQVCDAMISQIDIYPTLCELLGIDAPEWLEGESMMPVIRGEAEEINQEIYADVTYHAAYEPMRCVRTKRWKYIRRYGGRNEPVLPNCDDSPSKDLWLQNGWGEQFLYEEELYDLIFDPQERDNLAEDTVMLPEREAMRERLESWMRRTNDPLLQGRVPAPVGARVNDPDGLSPKESTEIVE
jgi:arylsulfatase A-like enzyme